MKGPKTHHLKDIWEKYALTLLGKNPEWWYASPNRTAKVKYEIIYKLHADAGTGKLQVLKVISYSEFRAIIEDFFIMAKEAVIEGKAVDLTSRLGKICGKRVERDHTKKKVNWPRTMKRPKVWSEEKQKMVPDKIIYLVDDDWCRINWYRLGMVTNETAYEFKPSDRTDSGIGFSQMFGKALEENKMLKYKFPYFPRAQRKIYANAV